MSAQDRAIQKLARELAGIKKEVVSWRGPQADYTSVENGGNFTFKDGDGNVTAVVGGQDDGSNTIRHVDGPVPPIPSGLSAHVDGPIVQVSWDGTFEDADTATWDWSHLEVVAVGPGDEQLTATISDITGASTSVAATASGEWTIVARSVSRAEKRSLDGDAGTVDVKLVDIDGAIEAVQDSANGKNKVTYSEYPPTAADPGIFDDTWFVGQVGRPDDLIEATNLATNPSFTTLNSPMSAGTMEVGGGATLSIDSSWSASGGTSLKVSPGTSSASSAYARSNAFSSPDGDWAGRTVTVSATIRLDADQAGSLDSGARKIVIGYRNANADFIWAHASSEQPPNAPGEYRVSATATFPADDFGSWFIRLMNGSASVPVWWDALDVAEVSAARPYFDGDTPNGTTDNDPHYRWTDTPHASTSEKYLPALTIGDSDNWNVIEQYRHDGSGWVKVELSHKVFSTVDLGKATVGELDGIRIAAQTIRGQQLSGDAIDGKVITGPTIQSARTGQRWVGDTSGIRIFNADNEVRTKLSPDDSVFKGEVEADSLIVNGGSELRSTENKLGQGAKLTLESGVTDPTAPPTVQPYWDSTDFEITRPYTNVGPLVGLAWDGTHYWTAHKDNQGTRRSRIFAVRIDPSTGVGTYVGGQLPENVPYSSEVFGVTCIGSELFWLYRSGYTGFVLVTDLNCVKKREWEYEDLGYSKTNPLKYRPGIGNNGTEVVIGHCADAGALRWRIYNKTTGALGSYIDTGDNTASDITGVYMGAGDWGSTYVTFAKPKTRAFVTYTTSGTYQPTRTWGAADDDEPAGVVFHDGKFHSLSAGGRVAEYADNNTGDKSGDWWATYRWSVDADDDGINDYTSRIGPVKKFSWPLRAKLRFMGAPLPAGVGYITPSIAKKATSPVRTDFRTPSFSVYVGESTALISILPTGWQSGAAPGDSSDFPNAEPSTLVSASSTFQVNGDGSGRWGPLTFNPDGTMTSTQIPAWVPITSFASGFGPQTWAFAPAYRVWPDGKVEWRGTVAGTINGTMDIFTVPAAARPAQAVNVVGASTSAATSSLVKRIEFNSNAAPTMCRVYRGDADSTWVSLDSISYYKS